MKDLADIIQAGIDPSNGLQPISEELKQATLHGLEKEQQQLLQQLQQNKQALALFRGEQTPPEGQAESSTLQNLLPQALQRFHRRCEGQEGPMPLPWPILEHQLEGGLWPGLHILVGNTGCGKSQWALQTALYAAHRNWPVLYVALELGEDDLMARLLGLESGIHWSQIWHGRKKALERLEDANARLMPLPFHQATVPPYGWDYTRLRTMAIDIAHQYKRPPLIVLDFLQLVDSPPTVREDLRTRIQKTAYAARSLARELLSPVLLLSSTARDKYNQLAGREGKPWEQPATFLVGLGKECGEIEYAADSVLVMVKEPWSNAEHVPKRESNIHLGIAKRRDGPAGTWLPFTFNGSRFEEEVLSSNQSTTWEQK